jgi:chorismate dehydratase
MSPPRPRLAVVDFLNAVPLFWGLQHGPLSSAFELQHLLPSKCADALREGKVDGAILPSIEYQRINGLKIVPGLAIASPGPVRSVLLISRVPIEEIGSLALDTSSRTSVCLVQIILRRRYQIQPRVEHCAPPLSDMLQGRDAALIIGDPALASDFPGLHVYDMADEWRDMTGLPFVFAIWTVRTEAASQADWARLLRQSLGYSMAHLNEIAQHETERTGFPISLIHSYLTENIDFTLGEKNLEGLRTFYRLAHEAGLTEGVRELEFVA